MSNTILTEQSTKDFKPDELLYTAVISQYQDTDTNKFVTEILFDVFKFLKFTDIKDQPIEVEKNVNSYAKLQEIATLTIDEVLDPIVIQEAVKQSDDREKEKEGTTIKYKSVTKGYFKTPLEAIASFHNKVSGIVNELDKAHHKILDHEDKLRGIKK
jgi:hypothetical protein